MEICVKMMVVTKNEENMHSFYLEEGESQISAEVEERYFSASELAGVTYEELVHEVEGIFSYSVELTLAEESVVICSTVEVFESVLIELGLLDEVDEDACVLNISDYRVCEEKLEEVA
jgi:hypothetical protein